MSVEDEVTRLTEHLRLALTRYIGDPPPSEERLRAACDSALERMRNSDFLPLMGTRTETVLRYAVEVGFGLRDPKDLIDKIEDLTDNELEEFIEAYGSGPEGLFMLVQLKRKGEVDYIITGSRPGLLEMNVVFKQPLQWISLDVVLEDEGDGEDQDQG